MTIDIHEHLVRRKTTISPLNDEEHYSVETFKEKALLLRDAKSRQSFIPIAKSTLDANRNCIHFEANNPERADIELLAVRYRFFFAEKEPTHALKFLDLLYRKSEDAWAKNYIAHIRKRFNAFLNDSSIFNVTGHSYKNKDVIDLCFNSEIFHTDSGKRTKLNEMKAAAGDEAIKFQLNSSMRLFESEISLIFHMVHKTHHDHLFIYTPNYHYTPKTTTARSNI